MQELEPTPTGSLSLRKGISQTTVNGGDIRFYPTALVLVRSIDTTLLDLNGFLKPDRHSLIQNTPVVTFELAVVTTSGDYSIWRSNTSDPVAGFRLPRKIFTLPEQLQVVYVVFRMISISNLHPDFVVTNGSKLRLYPSLSPMMSPLNILDTPHFSIEKCGLVDTLHASEPQSNVISGYGGRMLVSIGNKNIHYIDAGMVGLSIDISIDLATHIDLNALNAANATYLLDVFKRTTFTLYARYDSTSDILWTFTVSPQTLTASLPSFILVKRDQPLVSLELIATPASTLTPGFNTLQFRKSYKIIIKTSKNFDLGAIALLRYIPFDDPSAQLQLSERFTMITDGIRFSYDDTQLPLRYFSGLSTSPSNKWLITSRPYSAVQDIPGVSIDQNGGIVVSQGASYVGNAYLIIENSDGLRAWKLMRLEILQKPLIVSPLRVATSMTEYQDFKLQMTLSTPYTGKLQWSISPQHNALFITRDDGLITFDRHNVFNDYVTVSTVNALGFTSSVRFEMMVVQTPSIIRTSDIQASVTTSFFKTFQVADYLQSYVMWYITPQANALYTLSPRGVLTVPNQTYVNTMVTIIADNQLLGIDSYSIRLHVAQKPSIIRFPGNALVVQVTLNETSANIPLTQTAVGTGLVQWRISTGPAAVTVSSDGVLNLSLINGPIIRQPVTLVAFNDMYSSDKANSFDTYTFSASIARFPRVVQPPPSAFIVSLSDGQDFVYTLTNSVGLTGTLAWTTDTTNPALQIDASGRLYFPYTAGYLKEQVRVIATNPLGGASEILLDLDIQHTPLFLPDNLLPGFEVTQSGLLFAKTNTMSRDFELDINSLLVPRSGYNTSTWSWAVSKTSEAIALDASGILTVKYDNYVSDNITVSVRNSALGVASLTFRLTVLQAAAIANPGYIVINNSKTSDATMVIRQTTLPSAVGTLSWQISDPGLRIAVSGANAIITFKRFNFIQDSIRVSTINDINHLESTEFNVLLAQQPELTRPSRLRDIMDLENFTYYFAMNHFESLVENVGSGQIQWAISSYPALSINASGVITFLRKNTITQNVTVTATNLAGGIASVQFYMSVSQRVELTDISEPIIYSMGYLTNFTRSLASTLVATNIKLWEIFPILSPPSLLQPNVVTSGVVTVNSTTGLLTVRYNNYVEGSFDLRIIQEQLTASGTFVKRNVVYQVQSAALGMRLNQSGIGFVNVSGAMVNASGIFYLQPGMFVNSSGFLDTGTGTSQEIQRLYVTQSGSLSRIQSESYIALPLYISTSGFVIDASGIYNNAMELSFNVSGYVVNRDASYYIIDSSGEIYFNTSGLQIDTSGYLVDRTGAFLNTSGVYVNASGSYINTSGFLVDTSGVVDTTAYYGFDVTDRIYKDVVTAYVLNMIICQTPVVVFPTTTISAPIVGTTGFSLIVSTPTYLKSINHGPLAWSMLPVSIPGIALINGLLSVSPSAGYYNDDITVIARNNAGGSSEPIVRLLVAHKPAIIQSNINVTVSHEDEYIHPTAVALAKNASFTGPLTWTLVDPPYGVSITTEGQIVLAAGEFIINAAITVTVDNLIGGSEGTDTKTFNVTILRAPVFSIPKLTIEYIL